MARSNLTQNIKLFTASYDKTIAPSDVVKINVRIYGFELVSIDEKNQIMTLSCNLVQM